MKKESIFLFLEDGNYERRCEELHVLSLCFRFVFNLHDLSLVFAQEKKIELQNGSENLYPDVLNTLEKSGCISSCLIMMMSSCTRLPRR